jgi:glutaminase
MVMEQPSNEFVSTGSLPAGARVSALVTEAYARFKDNSDGAVSDVYPALAAVPEDQFGICVAAADGALYAAGDADAPFAIMSVSKPFVFALVCEMLGAEEVRTKIGVNSTGLPFDSAAAIERSRDGTTNPMVNAGAIATTSLVPGAGTDAKWQFIHEGLSLFAGRSLELDEDMYASASASNARNQALARMLQSTGRIYASPTDATDLYTKQCALTVTARDVAVMGATLAGAGVNPITRRQVVDPSVCHYTLAVMLTAGLYETSGDWLYEIGLPGKSGIGGGIVTISPGKGALATFAPKLDPYGNSVKGQLVARFLSRALGLDLLASNRR